MFPNLFAQTAGPRLPKDSPETWLLPALQSAASTGSSPHPITVHATQIRHDHGRQLLLESRAEGTLSPSSAAGVPELGTLWVGGPEAVLQVKVPTGYSLYTYPDR